MNKSEIQNYQTIKGERMAQSQNLPTTHQDLTISKALTPIVEAFMVDSEELAKGLLNQAVNAIYYKKREEYSFDDVSKPITKKEIDEVFALMKTINPKDVIEALHGAQIIVGHLLGMRKLSQSCRDDQRLGIKLLRLSSDALERLERKRSGHQNINVTYHNTSMQTIVSQSQEV
jgi:hypothetical protein